MRRRNQNRIRQDGHHILNNRQEWTLRPDAEALRETPSLIPQLDRDTHEELHDLCPAVPLLGYHALQHTLANFQPHDDPLRSMTNLMRAIEKSAAHPRAHRIEKHLALLAVEAIDLQRPFVKEGLILPKGERHLTIVS